MSLRLRPTNARVSHSAFTTSSTLILDLQSSTSISSSHGTLISSTIHFTPDRPPFSAVPHSASTTTHLAFNKNDVGPPDTTTFCPLSHRFAIRRQIAPLHLHERDISRFDHTFIRHSTSPPHVHLQSSGCRTRIPMRIYGFFECTLRGVYLRALTFLRGRVLMRTYFGGEFE